MKSGTVYDFDDYRAFLASRFPAKGEGRGGRSKLANSLKCELSFVSLVLNRRAHFSLEHAYGAAEYLSLSDSETEMFILLVSKNRAGSKKLEAYFQKKIDSLVKKRLAIQEQVRADQPLGLEQQLEYYSHWAYTAVHMCLLNKKLGSAEAIAGYLNIPVPLTKKIMEFFLVHGMARHEAGKIYSGPVRMHIPEDSPLVSKHHANWRMRCMEALSSPDKSDLHYSLVMSASSKAINEIRAILLNAIQKTEPVLKEAEDEKVYSFSLDLFEVGHRR